MNTNDEVIKEVVFKDDKIIVHIGKDGFDSTRFFIFSKSTATEVVEVLSKWVKGD